MGDSKLFSNINNLNLNENIIKNEQNKKISDYKRSSEIISPRLQIVNKEKEEEENKKEVKKEYTDERYKS